MNYIFSFYSRNSAFRFADAVGAMGGRAKMVNSPIKTGSGCGLAVSCDDYELCRDVLNCGHYTALRAVYSFDGDNYRPLYDAND